MVGRARTTPAGCSASASGYFRGPANRWVELDPETIWYDFRDEVGEGMETVAAAGKSFTAAEYVNGRIFTAATDGCMYTTLHGQWANYQKVGRFAGITDAIADMALNVQNGKLYALDTHNTLYTVDMITGALTQVATLSGASSGRVVQRTGIPNPGH